MIGINRNQSNSMNILAFNAPNLKILKTISISLQNKCKPCQQNYYLSNVDQCGKLFYCAAGRNRRSLFLIPKKKKKILNHG